MRTTATQPISHAADGSTAVPAGPPAVALSAGAGAPGVVDQVADLGTVGEASAAAEDAGNTAAVSTHAGPEADPYHLGG